MAKNVKLRVVGNFRRDLFRIIARRNPRLEMDPPRPGESRTVFADAVAQGDTAIAEIELGVRYSWEVWITMPDSEESLKLGVVPPPVHQSLTQRVRTIDLREPVRLGVLGRYWRFDQSSFTHLEIIPMSYLVNVRKTELVPRALLQFYKSNDWPDGFDSRRRNMGGEAIRGGDLNSPFIFYLLKGEDCEIEIKSTAANIPQRTETKNLRNALFNSDVVLDLKEETTRVKFIFKNDDGTPTPARFIWPFHESYRMDQRYNSTMDSQGRSVFVREFRRIEGWKLYATEDTNPPCSSVFGRPFPPLTSEHTSRTIKFSPVPETVRIKIHCAVELLVDPNEPTVLLEFYKLDCETENVEYPPVASTWVTCDRIEHRSWNAIKSIELRGGYCWLISCWYMPPGTDSYDHRFARRMSGYVGPVNTEEVYTALFWYSG